VPASWGLGTVRLDPSVALELAHTTARVLIVVASVLGYTSNPCWPSHDPVSASYSPGRNARSSFVPEQQWSPLVPGIPTLLRSGLVRG
jgi:hypothetical protein